MQTQKLKLKLVVMEAPVINGFSYPFLYALVNELRQREKVGELFTDEVPDGDNRRSVSDGTKGIIDYVGQQVNCSIDFNFENAVRVADIQSLLKAAEELLAIFKPTTMEYLEAGRTPEKL